ncbi:MAG: hypothetical protein ABIW34_07225 [Ginsengibacter sp.]
MKIIKLLFAGFLVLFLHTKLLAQKNDVDSVTAQLGDLSTQSFGDTVVSRNKVETDSIKDYKKDKDFAYMKYLDSLLRKTKGLTVDTFSVNTASTKSNKDVQQNSEPLNTHTGINIFNQPGVKIILWILAFFLIGFIIYKLFLGENFFKRSRSYDTNDTQKEEESISDPSAYDKLISQALMNKNYRLAVRYGFLQTLQMLSESGLVQLSADKTNYQYVNELRGKPYQNDFAALTLNYEYVWYGKFDISEDVYNRLHKEYKSFHQKL